METRPWVTGSWDNSSVYLIRIAVEAACNVYLEEKFQEFRKWVRMFDWLTTRDQKEEK